MQALERRLFHTAKKPEVERCIVLTEGYDPLSYTQCVRHELAVEAEDERDVPASASEATAPNGAIFRNRAGVSQTRQMFDDFCAFRVCKKSDLRLRPCASEGSNCRCGEEGIADSRDIDDEDRRRLGNASLHSRHRAA